VDLLGSRRVRALARAVAPVVAGAAGGCGVGDLAALLARAAGSGWRKITERVGRPASTVRGWLGRFAAHAELIRVGFAGLERGVGDGGDLDRLVPAGGVTADAVAQIGAACAAVRRAWGPAVFTVSVAEMVAACSGGWLLGSQPVPARGLWINTPRHL